MKMLIVGGSGFVGCNLVRYFSNGHEVISTRYNSLQASYNNVVHISLRANSPDAVQDVLESVRPEVVINAAGYKDVRGCEQHPLAAFKCNVEIPAVLASGCRNVGCKLVHISTDLVFSGEHWPFAEHDRPAPLTVYGHTKLAGEHVCNIASGALVIRSGGLYGPGSPLLAEAHKKLKANEPISGFTNARNTPTYVGTLAAGIERLLLAGQSGLFHVADADIVSRHGLLLAFAEVFGYDPSLVRPAEAPSNLLLPPDVSLRSVYRATESGRLRDGLTKLKAEPCESH